MEPEALYVGIDVAKSHVDVAVHPTDDRWVVGHDTLAAAILAHFAAAVRLPVRPLRDADVHYSCRLTFKTVAPSPSRGRVTGQSRTTPVTIRAALACQR